MTTGPSDPNWAELSVEEKLAWYQNRAAAFNAAAVAATSAMRGPTMPPPPSRIQRRRRRALIGGVATVVVLALAGGGWGIATAARHHNAAQRAAHTAAGHKAAIATCRSQIGGFLGKLRDIDSRLEVGMNEADYSKAVQDASVAANRIVESDLSPECASVFDLASDTLTRYSAIASDWNDCIYDSDDCDADTDVDYSGWSAATSEIKEAYAAMLAGRMANSDDGSSS